MYERMWDNITYFIRVLVLFWSDSSPSSVAGRSWNPPISLVGQTPTNVTCLLPATIEQTDKLASLVFRQVVMKQWRERRGDLTTTRVRQWTRSSRWDEQGRHLNTGLDQSVPLACRQLVMSWQFVIRLSNVKGATHTLRKWWVTPTYLGQQCELFRASERSLTIRRARKQIDCTTCYLKIAGNVSRTWKCYHMSDVWNELKFSKIHFKYNNHKWLLCDISNSQMHSL
jgi:hypothetical protein